MDVKSNVTKKDERLESKSFHTINPDSYEAGFEISEAFSDLKPEVIILFSSIYYDFIEMFEGLYDGLGNRDAVIIGGTFDGFYETGAVSNNGISALGINSHHKIRWGINIRTGVENDSFDAGKTCMSDLLNKMNGNIDTAIVMAGMKCDGVQLVEGIREVFKNPFIGTLTGDDWAFKKGFVMANGEVHHDAVAILGISGDFSYIINTGNGWKPIGRMGEIDSAEGNVVHCINGKTAVDFLEEQYGLPPLEVALGLIPLGVFESPESESYFLRTPVNIDVASGKITYFGSIQQGKHVKVCGATQDDVLDGVNDALSAVKTAGFDPICALAISCGGRKWILRERLMEEVTRVFDCLGKSIPLVGGSSFGEIGPFKKSDGSYSDVYFHNESYVILFLGN